MLIYQMELNSCSDEKWFFFLIEVLLCRFLVTIILVKSDFSTHIFLFHSILLWEWSFFFKVTTVDNLDVFGMDLKEFAHEIQISIQCSCTVSQSSSNKMQVVIQGNQIAFVAELLTGMSSFFWNESLTQFSFP